MTTSRPELRSRWSGAQALLDRVVELCQGGEAWEVGLAGLPFVGEIEGGRDLRGAPLAGVSLTGADLRGADLTDADLRGADLSEAVLVKARLLGARAVEVVLWRAELSEAVLDGADLTKANLYQADLRRASLVSVTLDEAYLERAVMSGARLAHASLFGAQLPGADLSLGDLEGVKAQGADLAGADLHGAQLGGADLAGAILGRAVLAGALLEQATLAGADLKEADLAGAQLGGADLEDADLGRAGLCDAGLVAANLRRADLREARLSGADLRRAALDQVVAVQADFSRANLGGATLTGANLTDANCRGSFWSDADVDRACFDRAAIHGSTLYLAKGLDGVEATEVDVSPEAARRTYRPWNELVGRLERLYQTTANKDQTEVPVTKGSAPPLELGPGSLFGRYRIEDKLGEGGMGRIYRAIDQRLGRRVALKVLLSEDRGKATSRSTLRLEREARATALLDSPYAVRVFDVGEVDGAPFIAMELVQGQSLSCFVGKRQPGWPTRVRWLAEIAEALGGAHRLGIVHRDVKPDNVMVRDDGHVKVLDFGIARRAMSPDGAPGGGHATAIDALATLTLDGAVVGTPLYMAPEQIKGEPLDGRTDQFAWAVTGYELLAGQAVWKGNSFAILARILTEKPPPLATLSPGIPAGVVAVIERAMSKSPADRFPVMEAIVEALAPFAAAPPEPEMPGGIVAPEPPHLDEHATVAVDDSADGLGERTTSTRGPDSR
jgi:uncharacterized protein YjbI with pentapeptide repeats